MSYSITGLRYLAAVAAHGSFSAAARAEGVSQPTISNAVSAVEEACGARIFARSTRRLALTPAGDQLLPAVQVVLDALGELERATHLLRSPAQKLLRIGFSPLLGAQRLARVLSPFGAGQRAIEFVYKECTVGDMEQRLDAGSVDVVCGIGIAHATNRARQPLYADELRWISPNAAPAREHVGLRDVARERLVLTAGHCGLAGATRALFAAARIPIIEYAGQAMSYGVLEEWAELGIGGALIPVAHIRRAPSAALLVDGRPVRLEYEAVWRKDLLVADHAKAFARYLKTVAPRLVRGGAAGRARTRG
jgi:LysR family transcriptional regulator, hydrogen peroxide-inducible genes activator